jgi:hypothetical protein
MTLGQLENEKDADRATCARGLLAQLDFKFAVRLCIYSELFGTTNVLSKALQSPSLALAAAVDLVKGTLVTIGEMASNFDKLYAGAEQLCAELKVDLELAKSVRHRTRKADGEEQEKEHLRSEMAAACQSMHAEMTFRFLGPDHPVVFAGVDALRPGSHNFLDVKAITEFAVFYRITDPERPKVLKHQLKALRDLIGAIKPDLFESQLLLLKFVTRYQDAFNLVSKALAIALTIPASVQVQNGAFRP